MRLGTLIAGLLPGMVAAQGVAAAWIATSAQAPRPARVVTSVEGPAAQPETSRHDPPEPSEAAEPAGPVYPDPEHPAGDLLEVSIAKQRLTVWRDGEVVMRLVVSTGKKGFDTPTGHFRIGAKARTGRASTAS